MTFEDLKKNYSEEALSSWPGDPELRRTLFAPMLENLYENKIVYYERLMCVARIEEMVITPEDFKAKATVHELVERQANSRMNLSRLNDGWYFGAKWEYLTYSNNSFGMPYTSVAFITDPDFVKMIETLLRENNHREAERLIFESA